jgi:hypothetical protein
MLPRRLRQVASSAMAFTGQTRAHSPQPVQAAGSTHSRAPPGASVNWIAPVGQASRQLMQRMPRMARQDEARTATGRRDSDAGCASEVPNRNLRLARSGAASDGMAAALTLAPAGQ